MSVDPFFEPEAVSASTLWVPPEPHARTPLEPVMIFHLKRCSFRKKPPHPETGKKQLGCLHCGKAKYDMDHWGHPESANVFGSGAGGNAGSYQTPKKKWEEALTDYLIAAGLPKGLGYVYVEGTMGFPRRISSNGPDQGNFRSPLEKMLGDALEAGGWLETDNWLHYEVGNIGYVYDKGQSWTRLELHPSWETPVMKEAVAEQGTLL